MRNHLFNSIGYMGLALTVAAAAESTNGAGASTPATDKAKTVADDMDSRRIFPNAAAAAEYLNAASTQFKDFADTPLAFPGIADDGDFNPEIYTPETAVMVGTLRKAKEGIKCIYIAPIPTLDQLLSDDAGRTWVERIVNKELSHVAVRPLRDAEDISTVVDQMPTTRDAYISSAREGGGGILEAFNELYKQISATMGAKVAVWAKFKLTKQELKRAFESKGYAEEFYPALENRGEGKQSLFVVALELAKLAAAKKGLDATIFQRWLDTRDAKAFKAGEEEDDFDLDSMTETLMSEDAPADAAAQPEAPATAPAEGEQAPA